MQKKVLFVVFILVLALIGFFLFKAQNKNASTPPEKSVSNNSLSQYSTLTGIAWNAPQTANEQTVYGDITGEKTSGSLTGEIASVMNFENKELLKSQGYSVDVNLAADGPRSSNWGYSKTTNGEKQIIIFSYTTEPSSSNPNEPLQFNCPCKINLSIFQSNPFKENK